MLFRSKFGIPALEVYDFKHINNAINYIDEICRTIDENKLFKEAHKVSQAMQKYGGSFVENLGKALDRADLNNTTKIKNAFPEYWEKYLTLKVQNEQLQVQSSSR